jgi:hypothetical protein
MPRAVLFALCSCLIALGPINAYFYDGNKLVSYLREWEKAERSDPQTQWEHSGDYMGYVLAVFDSMSQELCPSANVTVGQVLAVVAKFLNEHPEEWSRPAYQLVAGALRSAFPCRPSKN